MVNLPRQTRYVRQSYACSIIQQNIKSTTLLIILNWTQLQNLNLKIATKMKTKLKWKEENDILRQK